MTRTDVTTKNTANVSAETHRGHQRPGFTLIEAVAAMFILTLAMTGIIVAYHRTLESVGEQILRERALAVAQRHMESLLGTLEEPNSIVTSGHDKIDPFFNWKMELKRIAVGEKKARSDGANTVISARVTVSCDREGAKSFKPISLTRYFSKLKPTEGNAIAVPLEMEMPEDEQWYQDLEKELGRKPTPDDIMAHFLKTMIAPNDNDRDADNRRTEKDDGAGRNKDNGESDVFNKKIEVLNEEDLLKLLQE
ncbi:MAG: prepilin-type N-terminal cleavage/methylation domain-containing protein [Phycisphaerae bacterium]|nr:prepilin-type N-terminal cleavage/methylation domain-containing protein [Phycisphaerae bacterium]